MKMMKEDLIKKINVTTSLVEFYKLKEEILKALKEEKTSKEVKK